MSSTIKQAIQALKSRVADAFAAVEAKGGTLPATQDTANLPAAIASIPAGGGGAYDFLKGVGATTSDVQIPNSIIEDRVEESEGSTDVIKQFTKISDINDNMFYNPPDNKRNILEVVVADTFTGSLYQPFMRNYALHTVIVGGGTYIKKVGSNSIYSFYQCKSLRNLYFIFDCDDYMLNASGFSQVTCLKEIYIKNIHNDFNISAWNALSYDSLLYIVQNLKNVSGKTLTIGTTNKSKLEATTDGQTALAAAQTMGWTIA